MAVPPESHETDNMARVWQNGAKVPKNIHDCIHNIIARTVKRQPNAPAIDAWDGKLTYRELDRLSSKLASQINQLGIGTDDIVPLCFEKSMWLSVAMLATLKSGAAFVMLDRLLPEERLQAMVRQTKPKIILTSATVEELASRLCENTLLAGPDLLNDEDMVSDSNSPKPTPSSIAYVAFTSGSTGIPKGCVISHQQFSSFLHHQAYDLGFRQGSRPYDFASYSFDLAIQNVLATLFMGGCLCVPSDTDRMNRLASSMAEMRSTSVLLTPTVARILDPDTVPELEILVLLGEVVTEYDTKRWWGKVQVVNAYGPTECSQLSTINCTATTPAEACSIGIGKGLVTWVVDPQNHNILLPWGETGELLVEGPLVGYGYLGEPEKTAAVFIEDPEWLLQGAYGVPGRQGRMYKTGDLVRYGEDGNIHVLGRKDTQVKIRGNRIELGEVEGRVQDCLPQATQVIAEAVLPAGVETGHFLAVFLQIPDAEPGEPDDTINTFGARLVEIDEGTRSELARHLPAYMIPSRFFSIPELPLTLTGKTDRKLLRSIGTALTKEHSTTYSVQDTESTLTQTEAKLRDAWGLALNKEKESIAPTDDFFSLGGDSITAMKVVSEARNMGLNLTVKDVFSHPTITELSQLDVESPIPIENEISTDDLIEPGTKEALLAEIDASLETLRSEDVQEILPQTDMHDSLVVEGLPDNLQYVDYYHIDFGRKVDVARLKQSCRQFLEAIPLMRALFLPFGGKHWTVIPKQIELPFKIVDAESSLEEALATYVHNDIATFKRKQIIMDFTLFRNQEQGYKLLTRISHVQYDGFCVADIFKSLVSLYQGEEMAPRTNMSTYLAHIKHKRPEAIEFWRERLQSAKFIDLKQHFSPPVTTNPLPPLRSFRVENEIPTPELPPGITASSFMSAAWATYLHRLLQSPDIIYNQIVNARNAAIPFPETIAGGCVNAIPIRASFYHPSSNPNSRPNTSLVHSVQTQFSTVGEADSLGFYDIISECTDWPRGTQIYSCVQHQNVNEDPGYEMDDGSIGHLRRFENTRRRPVFLYVISYPEGEKLRVQIFANNHMTTPAICQDLLDKFCPLIEEFAGMLRDEALLASAVASRVGSISGGSRIGSISGSRAGSISGSRGVSRAGTPKPLVGDRD